ncbi:hypothetical protein BDD12DRAFT_883625 [Trichophaea hybrida]|nr:hypothetical protein BDD12DRAFT_883625 [Trichophaea hybrida]
MVAYTIIKKPIVGPVTHSYCQASKAPDCGPAWPIGNTDSEALLVERMLAEARYKPEGEDFNAILETKEKVYEKMVRYLKIEGNPSEANADFKEANINDLVYVTIHPILFDFTCRTGRDIRLLREKEIVSMEFETGDTEEFVVVDLISVTEEKFVLVIEARRSSLRQAMKQCLLSMKDMRDVNDGGEVYGFVRTGETWRMLKYDGKSLP